MNLQSRLEDLRSKPEHVRRKVAFWSSFGFTAIVFVFWLASFSSWGVASHEVVASTIVNNADSPGQSLIAGVGSFFIDIKDLLLGPKKITYSAVEASPGN